MRRVVGLLFCLCVGCLSGVEPFELDGRFRLDLPLKVSRFVDCFLLDFPQAKGLRLLSENPDIEGNRVTRFRLEFEANAHLDIYGARELIFTIVDGFLGAVNRDKKLRPFLAKPIFTPADLDIRIRFRRRPCDPASYPFIGNISDVGVYDGRVVFYTINSYNNKVEVYRAETVEQSYFILRSLAG